VAASGVVRGDARILLVEDNEINRKVAQELLDSFGLDVTRAENGEEAIAMLNEEEFDGVLMDMQMPVMDGVTATREIRKNPRFAKLPIIALTANVMVSEQNEFMEAGVTDYIGKPIEPDRLVATLVKWVRSSRSTVNAPVGEVSQEAAAVTLPDLPGINVAESVRRMGGSATLYCTLLEKFRSNERNAATRIREALDAGDHSTAERLAHTLRGIAWTLGDKTLQESARLLESSIKKGDGDIDSLLVHTSQELATFIANIDRALEHHPV
jgi:CheY-like chemotaxis protein/HPt (histidine-containing phosphotransfer) domain-containing protein